MTQFDQTNDLNVVLEDIWQRLVRGKAERHSPFHTPIVASVDANNAPHQRVMVLRKVDRGAAFLRFHTDVRAGKTAQLAANNSVNVIGYDAGAKVQIRVSGLASLATSGEAADAAWVASAPSSRRCYLAEQAPSTVSEVATSGLPPAFEARVPTPAETEAGRHNFSVLTVNIHRLEWLHLASDGHRRAVFEQVGGAWKGQWLVP